MQTATTSPKQFPTAAETFAANERAAEAYCIRNGQRARAGDHFYPHCYGSLQTDYKHLLAAYNALAARVAASNAGNTVSDEDDATQQEEKHWVDSTVTQVDKFPALVIYGPSNNHLGPVCYVPGNERARGRAEAIAALLDQLGDR